MGVSRAQLDLQAVAVRRREVRPSPVDDDLPALVDETGALGAAEHRLGMHTVRGLALEHRRLVVSAKPGEPRVTGQGPHEQIGRDAIVIAETAARRLRPNGKPTLGPSLRVSLEPSASPDHQLQPHATAVNDRRGGLFSGPPPRDADYGTRPSLLEGSLNYEVEAIAGAPRRRTVQLRTKQNEASFLSRPRCQSGSKLAFAPGYARLDSARLR